MFHLNHSSTPFFVDVRDVVRTRSRVRRIRGFFDEEGEVESLDESFFSWTGDEAVPPDPSNSVPVVESTRAIFDMLATIIPIV